MTDGLERHYTIQEIAAEWKLSRWTIQRLFENEPGVLAIGTRLAARKRKYLTIRIPAHVKERVRQRLTVKRIA